MTVLWLVAANKRESESEEEPGLILYTVSLWIKLWKGFSELHSCHYLSKLKKDFNSTSIQLGLSLWDIALVCYNAGIPQKIMFLITKTHNQRSARNESDSDVSLICKYCCSSPFILSTTDHMYVHMSRLCVFSYYYLHLKATSNRLFQDLSDASSV